MRVIHRVRKPASESSVASNVLKHGTGALNIGSSRVSFDSDTDRASAKPGGRPTSKSGGDASKPDAGRELDRQDFTPKDNTKGRWPANVILQHRLDCAEGCVPGCPVADLDAQSGDRPVSGAAKRGRPARGGKTGAATVAFGIEEGNGTLHADKGGASRYYQQVGGNDDG